MECPSRPRWRYCTKGIRIDLTIEWLPAYAPELNPAEQVWNHTKYGDLANFIPDHIDDVADAVCMSITAQHHDNDLIRGFFK